MTDLDIIERVAEMFGGDRKVYCDPRSQVNPNHKDSYSISVAGYRAEEVMRLVAPRMGARRRARIDEILEEWRSRPRRASRKVNE